MSEVAIRVENLSKRYNIGVAEARPRTFAEAATRFLSSPIRNFRRVSRLSRDGGKGPGQAEADDWIWALREVSFEVRAGEVIGIIGRNGAGKSTLLKILSRITHPTGGRVTLDGRVASLLEVGTGFHPELTGRENVYLNGTILGMSRREIDRKFDEIVDFSGVEKFIDTPVKRYSSGMGVRLAFSVAAHLEPEILLVDEVLAVGDAEFQKKSLGKMGQVAKEGRTVIFVSHNMATVRSLCERSILIHHGKLLIDVNSAEAIDRYLNLDSSPSQNHTVHLAQPHDRSIWIESATILANGVPNSRVSMGDTITIEINFGSTKLISEPSVGYVISSGGGINILNANNIYQRSESMNSSSTSGTIFCHLGHVPLMEDRYYVSLWLGAAGIGDHHFIENALSFDVSERDLWGKGKLPTKKISALWWQTRFQFQERNTKD